MLSVEVVESNCISHSKDLTNTRLSICDFWLMNLQENATNNYIQYFSSDFNIQRTVIDLPLSLLLEHQVTQNIVYLNLKQIYLNIKCLLISLCSLLGFRCIQDSPQIHFQAGIERSPCGYLAIMERSILFEAMSIGESLILRIMRKII